ncbi:HD domain-containing protein [Candidatus Woesearchaeota archaeon]|nr:HD domain-containing protein [Candidatus Woesearchaeota archaeon]
MTKTDFSRLNELVKLKGVSRHGEINGRMESTAEHTWACMIVAEHFLKVVKQPLDEARVMKLIMYHDLVEIECGDVDILDEEGRKSKKQDELDGSRRLADKIPATIRDDFLKFFDEFEKGETMEAKFAIAMDKLEPMVHWALYHPGKLKRHGWTADIVVEKKRPFFEPFPELIDYLDEWLVYMKEKNYL